MNAPLEIRRNRKVVAALASGVVLSLTALTTGVAPAIADPGRGPGGRDPVAPITPTTIVVPDPVDTTPVPTKAVEAPTIVAPVVPVVPAIPSTPPTADIAVPQVPAVQKPADVLPPAPVPTPIPAPAQAPAVSTERSVAPPAAVVPPAAIADPPAKNTPPPTPRLVPPPTVDKAPATPAAEAPAVVLPEVAASGAAAPSINALPPSPALVAPTGLPSASVAPEAQLRTDGIQLTEPQSTSAVAPSSAQGIVPAAQTIETVKPRALEAPQADVLVAKSSKPLEEKPNPAPESDVVALRSAIQRQDQNRGRDGDQFRDASDTRRGGYDRDRNVRQFDRDWVQYDQYYRPIILNPFRAPLRIAYIYLNAPRILIIPALASAVIEVAALAAYSFTAVIDTAANLVNTAVDVAVGTFFGGGYYPGIGRPAPLLPPLQRYDNVPVQVRYGQDVYRPFRVQQIVDVGDDAVYGERKVLLDGMTPAWGQWTQTRGGERQFEVHKTQQYPGLDEPREGPLPGNYQVALASDESPTGSGKDVYLTVAAVTLAAMSIGAVLLSMAIGRRRRET